MSIEAMKQALEALTDSIDDVQDGLNDNLPHAGYARYDRRIEVYREKIAKHEKAITALRAAIEEAEKQGPMLSIDRLDQWLDANLRKKLAPPEWIGLTDGEMEETWRESQTFVGLVSFKEIYRAIEAKLKEKNT